MSEIKTISVEEMLRDLSEQHAGPSAPLLILSYLPEGLFYGALARYGKGFGKERVTVASTKQRTLSGVMRELRKAVAYRALAPVVEVAEVEATDDGEIPF